MTDDRIALSVRLKPTDHAAIKRMAMHKGTSINHILNILVSRSIPEKYYRDLYAEEDQQ